MGTDKVKIIVATHKQYEMPKDEIYLPLHVGAEGKMDAYGHPLDLGYVKDNTGDHISEKNPYYCELTGLYWAWKNLECEYLGLVHYRRYFVWKRKSNNPFKNILNVDELNQLLADSRVIVPKKRCYYIETLYTHYAHTHYAEHLDIAREIIQNRYPQYLNSFDLVMKQRSGYMFNMFIMERTLLDRYCRWLFDILFRLEGSVGTQDLSFYQGRFYGRVSEILWNVWFRYQMENNEIKRNDVRELSCVYMETIDWKRKIYSFLRAKFMHKRYEGSF